MSVANSSGQNASKVSEWFEQLPHECGILNKCSLAEIVVSTGKKQFEGIGPLEEIVNYPMQ